MDAHQVAHEGAVTEAAQEHPKPPPSPPAAHPPLLCLCQNWREIGTSKVGWERWKERLWEPAAGGLLLGG